jgi:hypothetical protein
MFTLRPRVTTAPLFPASSSLLSASRGFLPGCILLLALWWTCGNATAAALTDQQAKWVSHAHRESRHGWIYLRIQGSAEERGFQHGYLMGEEIAEEIRVRRALWKQGSSHEWSWLVEKAAAMFAPKIDPENRMELEAIAAGMTASLNPTTLDELIAYNAYFELEWYWWPKELKKIKDTAVPPKKEGCSSFIATGSMTKGGGIVLGHNTWFGFAMASANVVLDVRPERGHHILMQTYPGWIHSGTDFFITDAGLIGSETTMDGMSGFDEKGVPEFCRFRRATQDANSIDEWCAIMKAGNNGGYANAWLLGDINSGEIARLELGLTQVAFERTKDGYYVGSNIAEDLKILRLEAEDKDQDIRANSVARRVRWKQLIRKNAGRIDLATGERMLSDHFDAFHGKTRPGSRSLCGHGDVESDPGPAGTPFQPGGCFDAKVVDTALARKMSFNARWGRACGTPFDAKRFLANHPQFDWLHGLIKDRPRQPWTRFEAVK